MQRKPNSIIRSELGTVDRVACLRLAFFVLQREVNEREMLKIQQPQTKTFSLMQKQDVNESL